MGNGLVNVDVGSVISGIGSLAKDIRTAFTGKDPALEAKILELTSQIDIAQAAINQAEAASPSLFVSGWRPAVGWVCVFALAWYFIFMPVITYTLDAFNITITIPAFDTGELITLLFGMLGLSGMKTYEKVKGAK
jgi:hypothetical protein